MKTVAGSLALAFAVLLVYPAAIGRGEEKSDITHEVIWLSVARPSVDGAILMPGSVRPGTAMALLLKSDTKLIVGPDLENTNLQVFGDDLGRSLIDRRGAPRPYVQFQELHTFLTRSEFPELSAHRNQAVLEITSPQLAGAGASRLTAKGTAGLLVPNQAYFL
jgi:hypothetical protein